MFAQEDVLEDIDKKQDFGSLLKVLRVNKRVKQTEILAQLPGWTPSMYVRLENGEAAPAFDQLLPIYRAFQMAGIGFPLSARHQFVERARTRIDGKKTYRDQHSDAEWAELRYQLTRMSSLPDDSPAPAHVVTKPLLAETGHLVGREDWREELMDLLTGTPRAKLVIVSGPAGVGKSSELNWLASYVLYERPFFSRLILCDFRAVERMNDAQEAFEVFVDSLLAELGLASPQPQIPPPSLDQQATILLEHLEKAAQPVIVLLDHAECLLGEQDMLAPCWQRFFTRFLRSQHSTTLVLATNRWAGWYHGEQRFVAHHELPPLSAEKGVLLLQQSGLDSVPVWLLEQVCEKVGGLPLCLEWVAALVKQPLVLDEWDAFGQGEAPLAVQAAASPPTLTQAVQRLLAEPHIFGGSLADAIAPLLERIIATQHLSVEAQKLLRVLAVATLPLAKPALQVFCPQGPRPIKELRNACMLVAYPKRSQLLPTVASAVYRQLSPEQRYEQETLLIQAYSAWVQEGKFQEGESEQGAVITELAVLLLKHHRLLEAAEHVIRYGWISFNLGHGPRLARLAKDVMGRFDWHTTEDNECGGLILHYMLSPFLGKELHREQRVKDYRFILDAAFNGKVILRPASLLMLTHYSMLHALNALRFTEAQEVLEVCCRHLEPLRAEDVSLHVALLLKQGMVLNCQCEHAEEQKNWQEAERQHEQAIALYRQVAEQLATCSTVSSHPYSRMLKRQQAYALNYLGYHLYRTKHYEESLMALEQALVLQEQGYADLDGLACCYGDISQTLAALGRFQEALRFDEKAYAEAQRQAETGHMLSQEEMWIYRVNRGCLYLRLGRIDEAESLLQEALPHISAHRRIYRMFAKEALEEIEQWRQQATSPEHQLDWRWVERFRTLASYDTYWWLAAAGPFTEQEQQEWEQKFRPDLDETTKSRLATLLMQARQREVEAALQEQREPCFHYPALAIQAVHARIGGLAQLEQEVSQDEPHALVRRFYHDAIEEELDTLHMIEATYQRNSGRFWEYMQRVIPAPTPEEMHYALASVRCDLRRGLSQAETQGAAEGLLHLLHERCGLSLDLSSTHMEEQQVCTPAHTPPTQEQHMVTVQAAKRFFEAVFQQSGFDGWRVIIDPHASHARVEQGMRCLFLEDHTLSVQAIKHLLAHELAGHVARCIAGERSLLGLLGIHTRNSLVTEEGLASYEETLEAMPTWKGQPEMIFRPGTLATGFASGVITPPQTFQSLFTLLESLFFLRRLLGRLDADEETARKKARQQASTRCVRTFRGVPDLTHAGICFTQDATYLRGLLMIEQAVKRDEHVLARLAVGVVALEQLADLQELGIVSTPQPLRTLLQDPRLDASILSFEQPNSAEAAQGEQKGGTGILKERSMWCNGIHISTYKQTNRDC